MHRVSIALGATLIATSISMFSASANTFGPQDTQPVAAFVRRLLDAQRDNLSGVQALNAQRANDDVQCLNDVNHEIVSLHLVMSEISDLLYLSSQMQVVGDEMIVNRTLSEQTRFGLGLLPHHRKGINLSAASCARNAFVSSKAQAALFLLDETERILRSISRRL